MPASSLFPKALGTRIARPWGRARNRLRARFARFGGHPTIAATLPEAIQMGDADRGQRLVSGVYPALGLDLPISGSLWDMTPPREPAAARIEAERQACLWLDDLAALGTKAGRTLAQAWTQDWIRRHGGGSGRGWTPESAGRRAKRWAAHAAFLTHGLDPIATRRFWRALAAHQRYLARGWEEAPPGLPRLRALAGLVWTGRVLPRPDQTELIAGLGELAADYVGAEGEVPSRAPEDLAEALILLIWTARLLDDAGESATPDFLAALARGVPVVRGLRLGDGTLARFHGGGPGTPERLDQALAELRLGVQAKPRLPMGYARLAGGRLTLLMDGGDPPSAPPPGPGVLTAHAAALAFEMSLGRQPLIVNAGPGRAFGRDWAHLCRQTAAHSTVEVDGRSSARFEGADLAARVFGERLTSGPTLVSVRQAQDATGMWLLATQDGYVASHGLLHERRIFVEARGRAARGEEILSVTDARARDRFDRVAGAGPVGIAARFHLHPAIATDLDPYRGAVTLTLPSGEIWMFTAAGGGVEIEDSVYFDPARAEPVTTKQVVVRAEVVEYLGQITWSFARVEEAPRARQGRGSPAVPGIGA